MFLVLRPIRDIKPINPIIISSTTGIAANLLERRYLGIEREMEFAEISKARREEIEDDKKAATYRLKIDDITKAKDTQTDIFSFHEAEAIYDLPFLD